MEAVVLGGAGLTGRCAVRDLAVGGHFASVKVADLDLAAARAAAEATGSSRVVVEALDVRDPAALRRTLDGASVCVNAVQYSENLRVMEACLDAGVPYLDFGGLFHTTRKQLELHRRFEEAGLLAIPGLGQVPGLSNVLARAATDDLDHVASVLLRDGWVDLTVGGPELSFPWSPATFLDEMEQPAMVWEDGRHRAEPPMSAPEEYDFPAPVGRTRIYRTLHSEPATLPDLLAAKGLKRCEWKEGGPGIDLVRQLAALGLGSTEPVELHGQRVVPRELLLRLVRDRGLLGVPKGVVVDDWEILDIEIHGTRAGVPVVRHARARFPPRPDWRLSATEYAVGVCGSVGAQLVADGTVVGAGVLPPERCVPPGRFREELGRRGIETVISPDEGELGPFRPGPSSG